MTIELLEETRFEQSTMYAIRIDDFIFKWFTSKDEANRMYEAIKKDPNIIKPIKNILKSDIVDVSLEN